MFTSPGGILGGASVSVATTIVPPFVFLLSPSLFAIRSPPTRPPAACGVPRAVDLVYSLTPPLIGGGYISMIIVPTG